MTCINVREGEGIVSIVTLDACGAPILGEGRLLQLSNISEFSFEDQIDEGDTITEKNFGGRKCYTDVGCDTISSIMLDMTSCGINPALDAFLTGSDIKLNIDDVVSGFSRIELDCAQNVAVEVLMQLDTDACTTGGEAPVAGWLFPLVKNWKPNGGTTLNGSDLVKPPYNGKGFKNPNLFDTIVTPLAKWTDVLNEATDWYSFYIFDGADVVMPSADCDPVTLTEYVS